jgi:homoserine kinase type II
MAVYTPIQPHDLEEVVADYGLGSLVSATPIPFGSVNTNYIVDATAGRVVLRIDEVNGELEHKRELDLLLFLRRESFPCPEPLVDRKGRHYRMLAGKCVSVYRHVDGIQHPAAALTCPQLEDAGRVLADLHSVGRGYKKGIENRFGFERLMQLYRAVRVELPPHYRRIVRTLDDEVAFLREYLETKLPKGIIHGDLFADNMIYDGDRVAVVLDFEASARGKLVFDLATLVNALCYLPSVGYDIRRFEAVLTGYENVRPLSLAEWDAFPNELRFSALRFTLTRLRDFSLRPSAGAARVDKDFTEFYERLQVLRREREGGMEHLLMAMATGYDYRKYQRGKTADKKLQP